MPSSSDVDLRPLQDKFSTLFRLSAPASPDDRVVWRTFVEDPGYRAEVARHARQLVRAGRAPKSLCEDIQQEAMLSLARQLRRSPDLHVDWQRVEEKFCVWVRVIVLRQCREAVRTLRKVHRPAPDVCAAPRTVPGPANAVDARIDIGMAIDRLPDPLRDAVAVFGHVDSVRGTADRLGIGYWQARRWVRDAIRELRRSLDAYADSPSGSESAGCEREDRNR